MAAKGTIYGINGPIVYIAGDSGFQMNEMVYVGEANLVGEVIGLTSERTTIEVYEETTGLKPGEPVTGTGAPVSVTLAPGIITNIFDGIERPLAAIKKSSGYYIDRGVHVTSLDTEKKWQTHMTVKRGDHVYGGTINLLSVTMARMGIEVRYANDRMTDEQVEALFDENTRLFFGETINNPALTAQVLVCVARASMRQQPGCYTMVEVPVIDLLPGDREEWIGHLV